MTTTPLFLDDQNKITFEKIALSIKLSDNVDNWQKEISSEIFKYLPFLTDYSVNVVIQRVNPERGYAFGSAQVTSRSENPQPAGPSAVIPLIVVDRILKPLDVFFFDEKALPLSEGRLREALFDGRTFETSGRKPTDQSMADQLYPPIRTNYGSGAGVTTGAAVSGAGFGKFASLAEAIAPTIPEDRVQEFIASLVSDPQLEAAAETNEAFQKAASKIVFAERVPASKTAQALVDNIPPTVVQFTKLANGNFLVKWANLNAFSPQEGAVTPSEAQEMAGGDALQGMNPGDSVTLGTEGLSDPAAAGDVQEAKEPGLYEVMVEENGQSATGYVLPVMDFDGTLMPLYLFTDGSVYSLQDEIAGSMVEESLEGLPTGQPGNDGAFVWETENGPVSSLPVTIQNQFTEEDGSTGFFAQTAFGETVRLLYCEGLQQLQQLDEETYCLPEDAVWTPLGDAVHLTKTQEDAEQVKEARLNPQRGWVRCTGVNEYHLDGAPFSKLAEDRRHWLSKAAAEFLLVTAGMNLIQAREKMASSQQSGLAAIDGLHTIQPLDGLHRESVKEAAQFLQSFPYHLRKDTVKIAASLDDTETADNILAMNFLNPENISIFADYLPNLDESAKKLAEMLVAARLGMKQVDEGALERAMNALEEVICGLKAIQQQELL